MAVDSESNKSKECQPHFSLQGFSSCLPLAACLPLLPFTLPVVSLEERWIGVEWGLTFRVSHWDFALACLR